MVGGGWWVVEDVRSGVFGVGAFNVRRWVAGWFVVRPGIVGVLVAFEPDMDPFAGQILYMDALAGLQLLLTVSLRPVCVVVLSCCW